MAQTSLSQFVDIIYSGNLILLERCKIQYCYRALLNPNFISYQLYGTKLFFFRPANVNCFCLLTFPFSAHPVLLTALSGYPNFRLQVHVPPCFPSATRCEKKSRLPITGIFKENRKRFELSGDRSK